MDAKKIGDIVEKLKADVLTEVNDRLPRKVSVIAVNHFKQNFRDSGWRDGGLQPWKETRRQREGGTSTEAKYGPLTSRRNHLMSSISAQAEPGQVTVLNPVPYAAIHNEGGSITSHPTVTPKMRKFAWAKVYALSGVKRSKGAKGKGKGKGKSKGVKLPKQLSPEAQIWKALALTKKTRLTIHANIPQRQFMGDSQELRSKIAATINESLKRIQDGITNLTNR